MTAADRRLARHLALAVALKLALLLLLWWAFIGDQRVTVDAERAAARLGGTVTQPGGPP